MFDDGNSCEQSMVLRAIPKSVPHLIEILCGNVFSLDTDRASSWSYHVC